MLGGNLDLSGLDCISETQTMVTMVLVIAHEVLRFKVAIYQILD